MKQNNDRNSTQNEKIKISRDEINVVSIIVVAAIVTIILSLIERNTITQKITWDKNQIDKIYNMREK